MTPLDLATLDAIASTLTDDVLRPFDVPRRPFLLGAPNEFCIRPGYVARSHPESGTSDTAAGSASADHLRDAVALIEARIGAVTCSRSNGESAPVHVVASYRQIERHPAPRELLSALAERTGDGSVLVLASAVRPMARESDHPGPPDDAGLLREWTFPELHAFLDACGFDVLFGGVLAADGNTALMIAARR